MGLRKDLMDLAKEYKKDPKSQYYRHLKKILELSKNSNVSKKEVFEYVKTWYNGKI